MEFKLEQLRRARKSWERGEAPIVFGLGMVLVLALMVGYLSDLIRIGVAQVHSRNVVDLAAQKAGNEIDAAHFKTDQEVILNPGAQNVFLQSLGNAQKGNYSLQVTGLQMLEGNYFMRATITVHVPLNWLASVGIPEAVFHFDTVVEPSFGIGKQFD
jgi:hypothetical protein